jgi:dihydropteroate synthase
MSWRWLSIENEAEVDQLAMLAGIAPEALLYPPFCAFVTGASASVVAGERGGVRVLVGTEGTVFMGAPGALLRFGQETGRIPLVSAATAWIEGPLPMTIGSRRFDWTDPVVMGVVNVTPDSFSDGGRLSSVEAAVTHALKLERDGAGILDIGGESTRPRGAAYGDGAATVDEAEELRRVVPVVRALRSETDCPISIDTRKARVAEAALDAGASMINDVTGLLHDPELANVAARWDVPLCLMHTPADIESLSHELDSDDVVGEVMTGLRRAIAVALEAGVASERLIVDPGIGFGKSAAQNQYLLWHLDAVRALGRPLLIGASRKRFVALAASRGEALAGPSERLGASVGAAVTAVLRGAQIVRVHDVRETVQAVRVAATLRGSVDGGARLR